MKLNAARRLPSRTVLAGSFVAAAYLVLLRASWQRGAHPLVDFGREAYTAWRLSAGDLLYRDVASLFGALAPYVDAAAFTVLGTSLTVMFAVTALLTAVAVAVIYNFFSRTSGDLAAFLGSLLFLGVFAFGLYGSSNYNFLAPYARAAVWGVVLGMGAVACLERWIADPQNSGWALGAGLCAGATLLTKPEVAVAVAGATLVATALVWRAGDRGARRPVAWLLLGTAAPVAATFLAFWMVDSASLGLEALGAPYRPLFAEGLLSNEFYRNWLGLSEPFVRLTDVLGDALLLGGGLLGLALVDRSLPAPAGWRQRLLRLLILVGVFGGLLLLSLGDDLLFEVIPGATPVLLSVALAGCAIDLFRQTPGGDRRPGGDRLVALAVWLTFSLLLYLKLGLRPRFTHYGFYLAAPGGVALAVVMVDLIPRWMERIVGSSHLVRLAGFGLVATLALQGAAGVIAKKSGSDEVRIRTGADALWTGADVAPWIEPVLDRVDASSPPGGTLAVLPEGASLNYWSRRVNPTPFVSFLPPELAIYGAERMLRALEADPPDIIVLWNRHFEEYGADHFGASPATGSAILRFVRRNYEPLARIPGDGTEVVFEVLERTDRREAHTGTRSSSSRWTSRASSSTSAETRSSSTSWSRGGRTRPARATSSASGTSTASATPASAASGARVSRP
jgi:hypothetical protein